MLKKVFLRPFSQIFCLFAISKLRLSLYLYTASGTPCKRSLLRLSLLILTLFFLFPMSHPHTPAIIRRGNLQLFPLHPQPSAVKYAGKSNFKNPILIRTLRRGRFSPLVLAKRQMHKGTYILHLPFSENWIFSF